MIDWLIYTLHRPSTANIQCRPMCDSGSLDWGGGGGIEADRRIYQLAMINYLANFTELGRWNAEVAVVKMFWVWSTPARVFLDGAIGRISTMRILNRVLQTLTALSTKSRQAPIHADSACPVSDNLTSLTNNLYDSTVVTWSELLASLSCHFNHYCMCCVYCFQGE